MSLEHKAFVFDTDKFFIELKPLLESDLSNGNTDQLRAFIISNKASLTDPYEGHELDEDWECMIEDKDAHQYGDFALTKYYSPTTDIGLGSEWEDLHQLFSDISNFNSPTILGTPLGNIDNYFDPGKMGSYFKTSSDVIETLNFMNSIEQTVPTTLVEIFTDFKKSLNEAKKQNKGLYVTF